MAPDIRPIALFVLLLGASVLGPRFVPSHIPSGSGAIATDDLFSSEWRRIGVKTGHLNFEGDTVSLTNCDAAKTFGVSKTLKHPWPGKILQLRADVRTVDVIAGEKTWNKARLTLVQFVGGKAQYRRPHELVGLSGSNDWRTYRQTFAIADDTDSVKINVLLDRSIGELQARNLLLREVVPSLLYTFFSLSIIVCWLFFIVLAVKPFVSLINHERQRAVVSGLVWLVVGSIVVGAAMPASVRSGVSESISRLSPSPAVHNDDFRFDAPQGGEGEMNEVSFLNHFLSNFDPVSGAHFFLFFALALLLALASKTRLPYLVCSLALVAAATEFMQFVVEGRSPQVIDFAIDMAGVLFAVAGYVMFHSLHVASAVDA